jgi:hypothetical protein
MVRFRLPDNRTVSAESGFYLDGISYSPGWLLAASEKELADLSIVRVEETTREPVNHRFYMTVGDGEPTPRPLEHIREMLKNEVKQEARYIILKVFPDWKQTNMVARGVELQDSWRVNGTWTDSEKEEAALLAAAWSWIKAVREHSNVLEAEIDASDFETLTKWQSHDWPGR